MAGDKSTGGARGLLGNVALSGVVLGVVHGSGRAGGCNPAAPPPVLPPSPFLTPRRRVRLLLLLSSAFAVGALAACSEPAAPPPPPSPEADSARALLTRISPALAAEAVARLDGLTYVADVRLDEVNAEDSLIESATRRVRRRPDGEGGVREAIIETDSGAGLPARGAFGRLSLADPVARMLPDEPPYLAARTQERYRFRLLPEQTLYGRRVRGAEAVLRDEDDNEPIRRARAWADAETGAPVAVEVWRASSSAIFDEAGRAGVLLTPGPGGLVPERAWASTAFDVPFGPPRHLLLWMTVSNVTDAPVRTAPPTPPADTTGTDTTAAAPAPAQ